MDLTDYQQEMILLKSIGFGGKCRLCVFAREGYSSLLNGPP